MLYEPAANTNIEIQAVGRVRRPGQKKPQVIYRLFVEDTFNGYQEMKQLEKRMGEMAGWGGKDMEEAIRKLVRQKRYTLFGSLPYVRQSLS